MSPHGHPATLPTLERLYEEPGQALVELPAVLERAYGGGFGIARPCLFGNLVASLDGVVALPGGRESGQVISQASQADRFVMGLLRAVADAVIVGAGTFRRSPEHLWRPEVIYPPAASAYAELRAQLGLAPAPRLVLVSASGQLDTSRPALRDAWVFTGPRGAESLRGSLSSEARLIVSQGEEPALDELVSALHAAGCARLLTEGGPTLLAELVQRGLLDELFLTAAPTLFGRRPGDGRKSLVEGLDVAGAAFDLSSVRRHGSHLFLRYRFQRARS